MLMKKVIIYVFTAFLLSVTMAVEAQDTTIEADIVSQYIWRGQNLGDVSLQPSLGIDYNGWSLTAWGNVGISEPHDTEEFDLTLSYSTGGFNIGITDYWFNTGLDPENRYFKYDAHGTNHVFEANIGYDFGPLSLQWFTNLTGNDGVNRDDKRAYSSYFEANIPFTLATIDWAAMVGFVPFATTFYDTSGFAVTNLSLRATKDIKVTETFSIPIFGQITANPDAQKAYLVFGITLQP